MNERPNAPTLVAQAGDPTDADASATQLVDSPLVGRIRPFVMAHRGASALATENSLTAFRIAIEAGADIIETDLQLTADDRIVCLHDLTAERMTGEPLMVGRSTADQLKRLQLRSSHSSSVQGERIPLLEELLDLVPRHVVLALELKDARFASMHGANLLVEALSERIEDKSVFVISFDMNALNAVRRISPALPIGHITYSRVLPLQSADLLGPFWRLLRMNPFYVRHAHAMGRWVAPLDPDPHARLAYYVRKQVDAILTSNPEATRRLLDGLRGRG